MTPRHDKRQLVTPGNTDPFNHQKSFKTGISLHRAVARMVDIRHKEAGYTSRSAYIAGLVIYDFFCEHSHPLRARLMRQPIHVQERVFGVLLGQHRARPQQLEDILQRFIGEKK